MVRCLLIQDNRVLPAQLLERFAKTGLVIVRDDGLWTVARVESAQPDWWMEMQSA